MAIVDTYSEACDELAIRIREGVCSFDGSEGLAIAVFNRHIENDETPRMALVLVNMELLDHQEPMMLDGGDDSDWW